MTILVEYAPGQFGDWVRNNADSRCNKLCARCGETIGYAGYALRKGDRKIVHFMRDSNRAGYVLDCKSDAKYFQTELYGVSRQPTRTNRQQESEQRREKMLAKRYRAMARDIEFIADEDWRTLKATHEYGVKLAEMIDANLIDSLSKAGKTALMETHKEAVKSGFIKIAVTKVH